MKALMSTATGSLAVALLLAGTAAGQGAYVTNGACAACAYSLSDPACSSGCAPGGHGLSARGCDPKWTFTGGTLIMDRDTPDDRPLVTDRFRAGGNVLLDANEFDFDWRGGWEAGVIRHNVGATCWDLEGRYFRIDGWRAARSPVFSQAGSWARYATPLGNSAFATTVSGRYESHLDGAELNLRRPIGCGALTLLAGFRFAELDERGLTIFQDVGPGLNLAEHRVGAINDLYGFQLGADGKIWQRLCFRFDGKVRAGVYGNRAVSSVQVNQEAGPSFSSRATDNNTAFLGEAALTGACHIRDGLTLRAGYQVMWLESVAVAYDQLAVSDPVTGAATVDTSGGVFYEGVVISLEYRR